MKSIKKYDEFILEYDAKFSTRSKPIKLKKGDSILEEIKRRAPWYLENIKNITPIYRGFQGIRYWKYNKPRRVFTINPSEYTRYARNTDNHYIEIMDNSDYWSEYPKRSKSIICSTSIEKARKYGELYRVIPIDENSRVSVCPKDDIFNSFEYLFKELRKVTERGIYGLPGFNNWLSFGFGIPDDDGIDSHFIWGRINSVMDELQNMDEEDFNKDDWNFEIGKFAENVVKNDLTYDDFYYTLEEWMSPDNNGFKLIHYNRNSKIPENREVYTDANCLLVHEESLQAELNNKQ